MSKNIRPKSYILILFGYWEKLENTIEDVHAILDVLLHKRHIRYINSDNMLMVTFSSKEKIEEIDEYLNDSFPEYIETYFLFSKPRKFGMRLNNDLKKHLFDRNFDPKSIGHKEIKMPLNSPTDDEMDRKFLEAIQKIEKDLEYKKKDYTIDDILDKINDKGIKSLTKGELDFLKSKSNN